MKIVSDHQSRRSLLKKGRMAIALPFLFSHVDGLSKASYASSQRKLKQAPVRLVWMSPGHGHIEEHFYPTQAGSFSEIGLPIGLKPLKKHISDFSMLSQLTNRKNRQAHDGSEALLTCADVLGFSGKPRHNSVSCDTVAAMHLGGETRYRSLVLNSPGVVSNGHGGVAMSYRQDGHPIIGHNNPLDVYRLIFGGGISKEEQRSQLKKRQSVFDIMGFSGHLSQQNMDKNDREKLEEYMDSVRDVEKALSREQAWVDIPKPKAAFEEPEGELFGENEIKFMFKMMAIAFQTDSTRIATYRMPDTRLLKDMGMSEIPHTLSHYGSLENLRVLNLQRTTKWAELLSYFIDLLKQTADPQAPDGGSIFDNTIAYFGGGLRTAHRTKSVPAIIFGKGMGKFQYGEHWVAKEKDTPLANLWLTMLQRAGASIESFADSTRPLDELFFS